MFGFSKKKVGSKTDNGINAINEQMEDLAALAFLKVLETHDANTGSGNTLAELKQYVADICRAEGLPYSYPTLNALQVGFTLALASARDGHQEYMQGTLLVLKRELKKQRDEVVKQID